MSDNKRYLIIEISISENLSWAKLAEAIKAGVDATKGALFMDIRVAGSPDPYLLDDPDSPPEDWK